MGGCGAAILAVIILHCILGGIFPASGLRDVRVAVPVAVRRGARVKLSCEYDLENAQLYSVKWYRGDQEFFRFVPRDEPHTQVFPHPGINVDVSLSGARAVVLSDVQPGITGVYRCEVSADAPLFHTVIREAAMVVVDPPDDIPIVNIEDGRLQFAPGETLRANCTSPSSFPAANLTWFINGKQVPDFFVKDYPVANGYSAIVEKLLEDEGFEGNWLDGEKEGWKGVGEASQWLKALEGPLSGPGMETSVSGLEMRLDNAMLSFPAPPPPPLKGNRNGETTTPPGATIIRLRCLATLFTLYRRTTEVELIVLASGEDNAPKIAPVLHEEAQQATKSRGSWISRPYLFPAFLVNGIISLREDFGQISLMRRQHFVTYLVVLLYERIGCDIA